MEFKTLQVQSRHADSRLLEVRLNRPDVRNAFNETLIAELTEVFSNQAASPEVRAVVLRGNGQLFCAGGDLNWMKRSVELSLAENLEDTRRLTRLFELMNTCPKPLIGVIHGAAIGGGVGLVSVCDVVIAEKQTVFSLSEVRLGIVPACIGPFVVAKIGASHARSLFLSADRIKADRAREVGLIHEVIDGEGGLDPRLDQILANILLSGPQAVAKAKELVLNLTWPDRRAAIGDALDYVSRMLAELRVTPEGQEGLKAFLEKRKPNWQNEGDSNS